MLDKVIPDKAVEAMSKFGGTVLKTSLAKDAEQELLEALARGTGDPAASSRQRLGARIVGSVWRALSALTFPGPNFPQA
jgi:hypothetical protein